MRTSVMTSLATRWRSIVVGVLVSVAPVVFAPSAWAAHTAYLTNYFSDSVSAFAMAADGSLTALPASPVTTGAYPYRMAVTPDGRHLYVTNANSGNLSAFTIANDGSLSEVPGSPFPISGGGLAISPDGRHLYVGGVRAFAIASDGSLSEVPGAPFCGCGRGLAVSPDGHHLFATAGGESGSVLTFAIASDGSLSAVPGSGFASLPQDVAVSPDGGQLYVTHERMPVVSAFAVASDGTLTEAIGSPLATGGAYSSDGLAVTPDGRHLYVINQGFLIVAAFAIAHDASLTAVPGSPFPIFIGIPAGVAVSPDGRYLYVAASGGRPPGVYVFAIASDGSLTAVTGSPFATSGSWTAVVLTPDQGPVAAFSATAAPTGSASSFDASASRDPDGTVVSYHWDFGDGQTATTTTPTTTHTYANSGSFTVSLTVTDDAGCSTTQTFTGQTVSCNGSSAAQISHQLRVPLVTRVLAQLKDLLAYVTGLPPGKSLAHKVQAVIASYQTGRLRGTCSVLTALIKEAKAQRRKKLTVTQADHVITAAKGIRGAIGCSPWAARKK